MDRIFLKLQSLLFAASVLCSCGTTKIVTYSTPDKSDSLVNKHLSSENYFALIEDASLFPEKRETIVLYLSEKCESSAIPYKYIKQCLSDAQKQSDSLLISIFNDAMVSYQEEVFTKVKTMSLDDIIHYYKEAEDDREFLRPILLPSIYDGIDTLDYCLLRYYHGAFAETDLANDITKKWQVRRDEVWEEESKALEDYFNVEIGLINKLFQDSFNKMCNQIESKIPIIIETSIKSIDEGVADLLFFKVNSSSESLGNRVQNIVNKELPLSFLNQYSTKIGDDFSKAIYETRTSLAKQMVMSDDVTLPSLKAKSSISYHKLIIPQESLNAIDAIKTKVRRKQNAVSLVSTAFSFIPGVGWGYKVADVALGGTDIIYTIFSSKKESEEVSKLLASFADELYVSIIKQVSEQSKKIFDSYISSLKDSQIKYKNAIYEQL